MSEHRYPLVQPLTRAHDRQDFSCGNDMLDRYLKTQARPDMQRYLAQVFVLTEDNQKTIKGYYTLSNSSLFLAELSEGLRQRLPRYPKIPVTLLGRLAVDIRYQGQGIGRVLVGGCVASERTSGRGNWVYGCCGGYHR